MKNKAGLKRRIKMGNLITDDLGHHWKYDKKREKIFCVEAEEEAGEENGYFCKSEEDGKKLLRQYGYISCDLVLGCSNVSVEG